MSNDDAINLINMINYFSDKTICPCFDRIELSISDLSPIGNKMYEIFLYQSYAKSYEMARMQERYHLSTGRGECLQDAMDQLSKSMKVIR